MWVEYKEPKHQRQRPGRARLGPFGFRVEPTVGKTHIYDTTRRLWEALLQERLSAFKAEKGYRRGNILQRRDRRLLMPY